MVGLRLWARKYTWKTKSGACVIDLSPPAPAPFVLFICPVHNIETVVSKTYFMCQKLLLKSSESNSCDVG